MAMNTISMPERLLATCCLVATLAFAGCSDGADTAEVTALAGASTPITEFSDYRLSYTSTCGDGAFITFGTEIEVHGDEVVVIGGEEPSDVGSIARWNQMIEDVGTSEPVEIEHGDGGEPIRVQIGNPRALDNQFCVDVNEFEPLP